MNHETLRIWAWRLALGTAIVVGILSWQTQVGFLRSIIRMILSYLLIYGLSYGSLYGFEKAAPSSEDLSRNIASEGEANEGRGVFLDVAVGEEEMERSLAGQLDDNLSAGLLDAEKQADMVRRMGWDE